MTRDQYAELIERLTRNKSDWTEWSSFPPLVNPDGPAAAEAITALQAEVERLTEGFNAAVANKDHAARRLEAAEAKAEALRIAATDALAGWRYIRQNHGDLYGVGWDRVEQSLSQALAAGEAHDAQDA